MLENALERGTAIVALTIEDRERILWVIDDVEERAELRAVLLREHTWRVRQGLV